MVNDSQILNLLKAKLAHANQDCESETRAALTDLQSKIRYEGGRFHVPDFQDAANLLVRVIFCKEKRFNSEISHVLSASGTTLSPEELETAKGIVSGYFHEDRYLKRFDRFVESVERSASRYGLQFDPKVYRVDLASSLFIVGVKNATRRGLASVHAEIAIHCGVEFCGDNSSLLNVTTSKQGNDTMPDPKKVFVVHGRDGRLRDDFFAFLRTLGLEPIEWSDALKLTGKATPYIGETLESAFKNAQAVIVLLSPDDEVRLSPELWKVEEEEIEKNIKLQARPNVLFEAGMAFGTHSNRTLLIEVGQVKAFSDVAGRHVVRISNSADKRNEIVERLKTAGCDVKTSGNDWINTGDFNITRESKSDPFKNVKYRHTDLNEGDILAMLDDWWPKSKDTVPDNVRVNFSEVDELLSLPPGSTQKYISQVARKKGFKHGVSGNVVAVFEYDVTIDSFGTYLHPDPEST